MAGLRNRVNPGQKTLREKDEALNLQHAKTVVAPAVRESESADGESTRECSWESMRASYSQSEKALVRDVLNADKASLHRSAVGRLSCWAVDRPDMQHAVRICSKSCRAQEPMIGRDPSAWQDT